MWRTRYCCDGHRALCHKVMYSIICFSHTNTKLIFRVFRDTRSVFKGRSTFHGSGDTRFLPRTTVAGRKIRFQSKIEWCVARSITSTSYLLTGLCSLYSIVNSPFPCVDDRRSVEYPNIWQTQQVAQLTQGATVRAIINKHQVCTWLARYDLTMPAVVHTARYSMSATEQSAAFKEQSEAITECNTHHSVQHTSVTTHHHIFSNSTL